MKKDGLVLWAQIGFSVLMIGCHAEGIQELPRRGLLFVEARSEEGVRAGSYGDARILNLDTREAQWLTVDNYYDESPVFLRSRSLVVLGSNRSLSSPERLVLGGSETKGLFLLDPRTQSLVECTPTIRGGGAYSRLDYSTIQAFAGNDSLLICSDSDSTLYLIDVGSRSAWPYRTIHGITSIWDFSQAPQSGTILVEFEPKNNRRFGLSIADSGMICMPDTALWNSRLEIGSWRSDGETFLLSEKSDILEVSSVGRLIRRVQLDLPAWALGIHDGFYLDNRKVGFIVDSGRFGNPSEIGVADLNSGKVEWLTSTGRQKMSPRLLLEK